MMTIDDYRKAGILIAGDETAAPLIAEAGLDWMREHTTLEFDKADPESIKTLPACAKLFVVKYAETMRRASGMVSQSIEGMSMTFDSSGDVSDSIMALARTLLSGYLKSQVRFFPAQRRW